MRNDAQRALLDEARRLVGSGALIPPRRNYRQQLKVYESQTRDAGLYRMHGLRHDYALRRYEEITGWKAPAAGGPPRRTLTGARRRIDTAARRTIAQELGHSRLGAAVRWFVKRGREPAPARGTRFCSRNARRSERVTRPRRDGRSRRARGGAIRQATYAAQSSM